jgi:hypothetical protein
MQYVEGLNFELVRVLVCKIMKFGSGAAANRTDDAPPLG